MGLLISVEGGEYTGKTSVVVPGLAKVLEAAGINVRTSREPGGTAQGEKIRKDIFKKLRNDASQEELALLFNRSRQIHIQEVITPFLGIHRKNDAVLILDRYLDSTRIYQGLEGGVDLATIFRLEEKYVGPWFPNLTLILYFPMAAFDAVFRKRKSAKGHGKTPSREDTAWDNHTLAIHKRRQSLYMKLPRVARQRGENRQFASVDASQEPSEVIKHCIAACARLILDPTHRITCRPAKITEFQDLVSNIEKKNTPAA